MTTTCPTTNRSVSAWKPYGVVQFRPYCPTDGETKVLNLGQVSELNIANEVTEDSLPEACPSYAA